MEFLSLIPATGRLCKQALIIFTAASVISTAQAATPSKDLVELLELSGAYESLADTGEQLKLGFAQAAAEDPESSEEVEQMFYTLVDQHINEDKMKERINQIQVSDKVVADALVWYRSDLGRAFTKAEEAAAKPGQDEVMMQMVPQLMANESRVATENRILSTLDATELLVSMQLDIALTMIESMGSIEAKGERIDIAPIKQQMQANRPAMKAQVAQYMLVFMLYAHKDFSDAQMAQYEAFVNTDSGKQYNQLMLQAMIAAIGEAMTEFGEGFRVALQKVADEAA